MRHDSRIEGLKIENENDDEHDFGVATTPPLSLIFFQQLCPSALQSGTFLRRQTAQAVLGNLVEQVINLGSLVAGDRSGRWT
jgi:hypothetical protein